MTATWGLRDYDDQFFARELDSFVPDRVFDAHAHLYHIKHWERAQGAVSGPEVVTIEEFQRQIAWLMPRRKVTGLFFGVGFHAGFMESNHFVAEQVRPHSGNFSHMLVAPDMDPERVRETAKRLGFRGLKVYHSFVPAKPTWNADISSFLAEEHVRVADEEGWTITLHMVRNRAMADPANQERILYYCRKYPNMKLILAHAARGFNAYHTIEGIHVLRGLNNVWCDVSAVTESGAMEAIIDVLGHERMLWGSDYPISHRRGRCVSMGDQFVWLCEETLDWDTVSALGKVELLFIGHESLRALKQAAMRMRLSDSQVEDIFYNNALRLLTGGA